MVSIKLKFRPSTIEGKVGSLYYQVIYMRKVRQVSTNFRITRSEWDSKLEDLIIKDDDSSRANYLQYVQNHIEYDKKCFKRIVKKLTISDSPFTVDTIVDEFHKQSFEITLFSYMEHGNVFLTMPENMKDWNKYNAEITLKVGMIKNFLQFSVTGGFNHFDSRGNNYSHTHSNFYYRADVLAMYKKWMLIGQLQPFDERLYGETVIKDGNYHYLAIRYNATNFSFGIGAFNPFKNVSRTIMENKNAQAPFRRESFSDASRILVATLTWNFNFGKTHLVGTKSLNNQDTDYGIKGSYK